MLTKSDKMEQKTNEVTENHDETKKLKVNKMEERWRELHREGKRGDAILKVLCAEFYYKHPKSVYRVLDISRLRLEMRSN